MDSSIKVPKFNLGLMKVEERVEATFLLSMPKSLRGALFKFKCVVGVSHTKLCYMSLKTDFPFHSCPSKR